MPTSPPNNYCIDLDNGLSSDKCPCTPCKARRAQRQKIWRHRKAARERGEELEFDARDPEPSLKAITRAKNDLGIPFREISRVTGVNHDTLQRIYHQKVRWVWRKTEEVILANYGPDVEDVPRDFLPQTHVPWLKHRWMLECLYAQGWTQKLLTEMVQKSHQCTSQGRWIKNKNSTKRGDSIETRCLDELLWLVRTIEDKKGPSNHNRLRMLRAGVFPLIHYTEEGKLIRGSLTPEQLESLKRVQFKHGEANRGDHGSRPHSGRGRSN